MSFASDSVQTFLDQLASDQPVPGGGTVAALSGSLGASLVAMVCRLTIGRKGYEAVNAEMQTILGRAEKLQIELRDLMQADTDAYARVMDAYKLPKSADAEKLARTQAIQDALKHAVKVPMRVAELCAEVLALARPVAEHGNKNAASDGGVGALMAHAGLRGALFNVLINLGSIHDATFVQDHRARVNQFVVEAEQRQRDILAIVESRF